MGMQFWDTVGHEHGIGLDGVLVPPPDMKAPCHDVLYDSSAKGRYIPRALFFNLDPNATDYIRSGPAGKLFDPDAFVSGKCGAGSNWVRGHYDLGPEILDSCMDRVRKTAELCDSLEGFVWTHSMFGGTGGGLTTLIMSNTRERYPYRTFVSHSMVPSFPASTMAIFNTVFAFCQMQENCDLCCLMDNDALAMHSDIATYAQMDRVAARAASALTATTRFGGAQITSLRKLGTNLVPFPRHHYVVLSTARTAVLPHGAHPEVRELLFDPRLALLSCNMEDSSYIGAEVIARGKLPAGEIELQIQRTREEYAARFSEWAPDTIQWSLSTASPPDQDCSMTTVGNTSVVKGVMEKWQDGFITASRRKAFIHSCTNEGMDEMEFSEAESTIRDMTTDFPHQFRETEDDFD